MFLDIVHLVRFYFRGSLVNSFSVFIITIIIAVLYIGLVFNNNSLLSAVSLLTLSY